MDVPMAKRLSNRQRIERMAEEASTEAEIKEPVAEDGEPQPSVKKAPRAKKSAPKQKRMKLVWRVVDQSAREVASFPYREKPQADARAAELSQKTGKPHAVTSFRVPMGDDE
jgi:hypothetical protein